MLQKIIWFGLGIVVLKLFLLINIILRAIGLILGGLIRALNSFLRREIIMTRQAVIPLVAVGGQVLFLLFPAHSLVEVAVQNVGADLLHAGEGFLRVEPAVPRLHPLGGALHAAGASAADAPVHQK